MSESLITHPPVLTPVSFRRSIADALEIIAQRVLKASILNAAHEVLAEKKSGLSGAGWHPDYLLYQPDYEAIIDGRGRELGVTVHMGMTADGLEQDDKGVRTTFRPTSGAGAGSTVHSRYVVGADGPKSFVRDAMGSHRLDLGFKAMPHLVLDFEYSDPDIDLPQLPEAANILDPSRIQLAGRWGGRRGSRWEFAALDHESREHLEAESTGWELLSGWGIGPEHGRIVRQTVFEFESSIADTWRRGRVFLMGDAAHTSPPYLGQGLLSGIRDAANLAWKLAAVNAGMSSDRLLDTYQLEREAHVREIIDMAMATGRVFLITDPDKARERDEMLRQPGRPQRQIPRLTTGIVRPSGSPQSVEAPGADGRQGLQARVALGNRAARLDDLLPPRSWRLVSRHPVPMDLFDEQQRALIESLGLQFAHVSRGAHLETSFYDIDAEYDEWFMTTGRKAFIERPDHYVFGTAETIADVPGLLDDLGRALAEYGWRAAGELAPA